MLQVHIFYTCLFCKWKCFFSAILSQFVKSFCFSSRIFTFLFFLLPFKQFETALIKHIAVKVCVELVEFKLTLIHIETLRAGGREQGAAKSLGDTAVETTDARHGDLAYVLHTSGTTGFPKTVRVPHRCILPNILHLRSVRTCFCTRMAFLKESIKEISRVFLLRSLFQMRADDVVFLASPLTFDPSVVDIFLALSSGAQLLIVPNVIKKMPNRLAQLLFNDHKATFLQASADPSESAF